MKSIVKLISIVLLSHILCFCSSSSKTLFIDWKNIALPEEGLPDGKKFANGALRSNVEYDPFSMKIIDGKLHFIVDSKTPVDKKINADHQYHYRSEFTEWPWNINLPEGTEQWAGWSYYFPKEYVRAVTPISIFQNHAASSHPYPAYQLELTYPDQLEGSLGGEIQVINNCLNPRFRKMVNVRPNPGDRIDIILHVVHARDAKGLLEFWINGEQVHSQVGSTIYPAPENWGGNNKWGIYHHQWQKDEKVKEDIEAGHTRFELIIGNLKQITRSPKDPDYRKDAKALVDPKNF
ncbi:MAG TPA: hypothetical protein DGG95_04900 [Cytophagales bacterium]|jgi:hypothetical protein|nr:hypothetical protein [Cytophagales bacterium]